MLLFVVSGKIFVEPQLPYLGKSRHNIIFNYLQIIIQNERSIFRLDTRTEKLFLTVAITRVRKKFFRRILYKILLNIRSKVSENFGFSHLHGKIKYAIYCIIAFDQRGIEKYEISLSLLTANDDYDTIVIFSILPFNFVLLRITYVLWVEMFDVR